ncbi:hypothetical protein RF11_07810 [Thelohanellus kitauei]|uniref:ISXO2-like transposase domain-containing protein n=1 Tax=Thelohanellus kitauei TaxID=669202 RepID=A0A0C2MT84_THEKT|nr:hypothetical protein RF11_07810 [Thelohanellus kitauei]
MKRTFTAFTDERLTDEGQNITSLPTVKCKSCRTYLCVLTVFCLTWIEIEEPMVTLHQKRFSNHCREVCGRRNLAHFNNPPLGKGNEQRINYQTPDIGRRITGPWIFGLLKSHRRPDRHYKSGEVRLFVVENKGSVSRKSIIWSDMRPPYMRIGQDGDGLFMESENHSKRYMAKHEVRTQNIEKAHLLESHMQEYMWRNRINTDPVAVVCDLIEAAGLEFPLSL